MYLRSGCFRWRGKCACVELSSQFFVVLSAPFFFAAQLRCMLGKCSPRAHTRWPSTKPSRLAPETNSSRLVGRNQRAAPSFLVTVIYGHNGEDQPPKISRRRTTRFDGCRTSLPQFKRIARSEYSHLARDPLGTLGLAPRPQRHEPFWNGEACP